MFHIKIETVQKRAVSWQWMEMISFFYCKTDEESDVIMYQQLVRGLERYLRLFKPETRETVRMYVLDEIPMEKAVDTVSKRYRCDAEDLQKRVNNALRMMKHNK